jgi:hypothetical protein
VLLAGFVVRSQTKEEGSPMRSRSIVTLGLALALCVWFAAPAGA